GRLELVYDNVGVSPSGDYLVGNGSNPTGTFTAANGDKILGSFNCLSAATEDPNILGLAGTVRLTGGTGLFTNVKGSGVAIGQANISANEVTLTISGFVASPTLSPPPRGPRIR